MASVQKFENVEIQKTVESVETQKPQGTQWTKKNSGNSENSRTSGWRWFASFKWRPGFELTYRDSGNTIHF